MEHHLMHCRSRQINLEGGVTVEHWRRFGRYEDVRLPSFVTMLYHWCMTMLFGNVNPLFIAIYLSFTTVNSLNTYEMVCLLCVV